MTILVIITLLLASFQPQSQPTLYCVVVDVFPVDHVQEVRIYCETQDPTVERRWDQEFLETDEFVRMFNVAPRDGQVLLKEASIHGTWVGVVRSTRNLPHEIKRLMEYAKADRQ